MPICSYLAFPRPGDGEALGRRLEALPGWEVHPARDRSGLILVTDTPGSEEERALREAVDGMEELTALTLTFGEIVEP